MEVWTLPVLFREQLEPTEATGQVHVTGHGLQTGKLLMSVTLPMTQ